MSSEITTLSKHKYINLETYKKSGQPVRTPVWFMISDGLIFVLTTQKTGKVKRIKNNPNIRIAPCTIRGQLRGNWIDGTARFGDESETQNTIKLRAQKYGLRAKIIGLFIKKENPISIVIQI